MPETVWILKYDMASYGIQYNIQYAMQQKKPISFCEFYSFLFVVVLYSEKSIMENSSSPKIIWIFLLQ